MVACGVLREPTTRHTTGESAAALGRSSRRRGASVVEAAGVVVERARGALVVAHQREEGRLRDDEVALALERHLDGGLAEEEREVAEAGLQGDELRGRARGADAPRLVGVVAEVGKRRPRAGGDDLPALDGLAVDRGRGG